MSSSVPVQRLLRWFVSFVAIVLSITLLTMLSGCGATPEELESCGLVVKNDSPTIDSHDKAFGVRTSAMACGAGTAQYPPSRTFSRPIEGYASYAGQKTCSPSAKAGVAAFKDMVLKTYPCTGNYGIVRACSSGGQSEHKEGRAWDWKLNAPHPAADALLKWLLATDSKGNKHAMARRLGIMYMIWNRKMWRAYNASKGWQPYTGRSPHTDHVHFSFSWDGANKKTSFWSGSETPPTNLNAKFTGQSSKGTYPASGGAYFSVCPGQSFSMTFSLQNTGNVTWRDTNQTTAGNAVRLGFKKGERLGLPTRISINQSSRKVVAPGQSTTFTLNAKAPTKTGVVRSEWQMVSEMVAWFGPSLWQSMNVTNTPPGAGKECSLKSSGECGKGVLKCQNGKLTCVGSGTPKPEVCDGRDNNCNGQTDEGNPGGGKSCQTGDKGLCGQGQTQCRNGKLSCISNYKPTPERCDQKDNDCDGAIDENEVCKSSPAKEPTGPEPTVTEPPNKEPSREGTLVLDAGTGSKQRGNDGILRLESNSTPPGRTQGCLCSSTRDEAPSTLWWGLFLLLGLFRKVRKRK